MLPIDATAVEETMDPRDTTDYIANFTMDEDVIILSQDVVVAPEAASLGVSIVDNPPYVSEIVNDGKGVRFFLQVASEFHDHWAYKNGGTWVAVDITITTSQDPLPKTKTLAIKIRW